MEPCISVRFNSVIRKRVNSYTRLLCLVYLILHFSFIDTNTIVRTVTKFELALNALYRAYETNTTVPDYYDSGMTVI